MIYASVNRAIIGLDNGLSSVKRQTFIWTNGGVSVSLPLETSSGEILGHLKRNTSISIKRCIWNVSCIWNVVYKKRQFFSALIC